MRLLFTILSFFVLDTAYSQYPKTECSKKIPFQNEPFAVKYTVEGMTDSFYIKPNGNFNIIENLYTGHSSTLKDQYTSYNFILVAVKAGSLNLPTLSYTEGKSKRMRKVNAITIEIDPGKILSADSISIYDTLQPKFFNIKRPVELDEFDSTKTEIIIDSPKGSVKTGEEFTVRYATNSKEDVQWNKVDLPAGITLVSGPNQRTTTTIANGKTTKYSSYIYKLKVMQKGSCTIPGTTMIYNGKKIKINPITITAE